MYTRSVFIFSMLSYAGAYYWNGFGGGSAGTAGGAAIFWVAYPNFLVFRPNRLKFGQWVTLGTGFDILVKFWHFGYFDPILGVKKPQNGVKMGKFWLFEIFVPNWGGRSYAWPKSTIWPNFAILAILTPFLGGQNFRFFGFKNFFFEKMFEKIFNFFFFQKSTQNTQNDMLQNIIWTDFWLAARTRFTTLSEARD